ncbi:MAG: hypothetical protein ACLFN9_02830 [Desulfococcaceae bacterium]
MEIERLHQERLGKADQWSGWHILTVAEAGFSMLDIYGRHGHGLNTGTIHQFADQVNRRDEAGSLHPKAPVSALPRRFFREIPENEILNHIDEFKRHVREFIEANRNVIRARRILVDFHVSPAPVPDAYLSAAEQVFRKYADKDEIDNVVILE